MTVEQAISEIRSSRSKDPTKRIYDTKNQKDEINIMRAMMNDTSYQVDLYNNSGYQGTYNPARAIRNMFSNVISNTTGISKIEANNLIGNYEFSNNEAKDMIDFNKEYLNTYILKTGRKFSLGGRENSNISLKVKTNEPGFVKYPVKVGESKDGKNIYEFNQSYVPEYKSLTVYGPCPSWLLSDDKK